MTSSVLLGFTLILAGETLSPAINEIDAPCISLCETLSGTETLTQCLAGELQKAEAELTTLLKAALEQWKHEPDTSTDPEVRIAVDALSKAIPETLGSAQKKWQEYMSADCDAAGAVWTNGSGRGPAVFTCRVDRVRRRALDIWQIYLEPAADLPRPPKLCN